MASAFVSGETRVPLTLAEAQEGRETGALVLDSRRRRPLYFDGRFLAARDLTREQDYFLQRQADLGRTAGFGIVHGLTVAGPGTPGVSSRNAIRIEAGHGLTPSGELVMLPEAATIALADLEEERKLDLSFGVASIPMPSKRTRTGLYVLALRPLEFTANPIASYPTSIQGARQTHDGDVVEATGVTLVPFPNPGAGDPDQLRAQLAKEIFAGGGGALGTLNDSLLPLAILSLQRGDIDWMDTWLVRRELAAGHAGQQFGLADDATQAAYFRQYDAHLREILVARQQAGLDSNFSAAQYFRTLPPAGRFPLASIDGTTFVQSYFPEHLDVRLSIIPEDEVPALIEESMNLPPLDLTLAPDNYRDLALFALVPIRRDGFSDAKAKLPDVTFRSLSLPRISFRKPMDLLRLFRSSAEEAPPENAVTWKSVLASRPLGIYLRRRSAPKFFDFSNA